MTAVHNMERICFVTPLHGIEIEGDLGAGVQLGDHGWIGTDTTVIESYIGDDWEEELGAAVIRKLHGAKAYIFGELSAVPTEQRQDCFKNKVRMVQLFLDFLWVVRDNAVNCEMVTFGTWDEASRQWLKPIGMSPADAVSKADGLGFRASTKFSKEEIEIVAGYMKGVTDINPITHVHPAAFKTKKQKGQEEQIDRLSLGRFFVHLARRTKDITGKLSLYCSAFEAMLTTGSSEVAHQLAERVAIMIEDEPERRMAVYRRMKEIYKVRSKMTHGDIHTISDEKSIEEVARQCDNYLRKVIWSLVNAPIAEMTAKNGEMLEEYFQKRIFGAGQMIVGFFVQEDDHANT